MSTPTGARQPGSLPGLPGRLSLSSPTGADPDALFGLVCADEVDACGRTSITHAEITELLSPALTTVDDDQWLAVDNAGQPAAWIILWDHGDTRYQDIEAYRHPSRAGEDVRRLLVERACARAAQRAEAAGLDEAFVILGCHAGDEALAATARCAGFEHRRTFHRMRLDLDERAQLPTDLPPGVTTVPFDGSDEHWRAIHAVMESAFSQHFGYAPKTLAAYRADAEADPLPDREFWRLAVVDAAVVGAVQASGRNGELGGGYVRELGVLPAYRGRGIASALLRQTFAAYRAAGRTWVQLAVDVENTSGALGVYERVGLRSHEELHAYLRQVLSG